MMRRRAAIRGCPRRLVEQGLGPAHSEPAVGERAGHPIRLQRSRRAPALGDRRRCLWPVDLDYARTRLFEPLGIRTDEVFEPKLKRTSTLHHRGVRTVSVAWPVDPQGYHYGAAPAASARDLAKFGYLFLNGGRWDGQQVIPAEGLRGRGDLRGWLVAKRLEWLWLALVGRDRRRPHLFRARPRRAALRMWSGSWT